MVRTPSTKLDKVGAGLVYRIGSTATYKKIFRYWYPLMTRRLGQQEDVVFLNWGYEEDPPLGLPLDESDEPNRYSIQLYHQTATQADLSGKRCWSAVAGHGGGASYLDAHVEARLLHGAGLQRSRSRFCQKRHNLPGLDFVQGDAENLPFPDESFDAVINVEASHIYPHFERFLSEVARVLRPGGHFLYADFRNRDGFPAWEAALAESPTAACLRDGSSTSKFCAASTRTRRGPTELINRHLPAFLRRFGREFAVVDGSWFYNDLERGEIDYRSYHFTKD